MGEEIMKKLIVTTKDINEWAEENYIDYAAETVNDKRLRLKVSMKGKFKVTHGDKTLYNGRILWSAVRAFNLLEHSSNIPKIDPTGYIE